MRAHWSGLAPVGKGNLGKPSSSNSMPGAYNVIRKFYTDN